LKSFSAIICSSSTCSAIKASIDISIILVGIQNEILRS
jgi:hypothetical protein